MYGIIADKCTGAIYLGTGSHKELVLALLIGLCIGAKYRTQEHQIKAEIFHKKELLFYGIIRMLLSQFCLNINKPALIWV
jgi:uncharacterized membrane protein YadS